MAKTIADEALSLFPRGVFEKRRWLINDKLMKKLKMDLSVFGPVWSRPPRIVPVLVKDLNTRCFLCWERQEQTRSGKIGRRIVQANWATKSRKRLVKKKS